MITLVWVRWKKSVKLPITLDFEHMERAENLESTEGVYMKVDRPFNSLMMEFFKCSNFPEMIEHMSAHTKMQVENPRINERDFTENQIIHLHIKFH